MRSLSPAILALAVGLPGVVTGAHQQAVFRSTTEVVAVDVAVTRGRSPVTGLTAADFVVPATARIEITIPIGSGTRTSDLNDPPLCERKPRNAASQCS